MLGQLRVTCPTTLQCAVKKLRVLLGDCFLIFCMTKRVFLVFVAAAHTSKITTRLGSLLQCVKCWDNVA